MPKINAGTAPAYQVNAALAQEKPQRWRRASPSNTQNGLEAREQSWQYISLSKLKHEVENNNDGHR
jgi:hypothetical protein